MKDKICLMCHTVIDMDKEFCEFKHYSKKDVIKSKAFYHVVSFSNRLNNSSATNQVQLKALELMDKIGAKI